MFPVHFLTIVHGQKETSFGECASWQHCEDKLQRNKQKTRHTIKAITDDDDLMFSVWHTETQSLIQSARQKEKVQGQNVRRTNSMNRTTPGSDHLHAKD